MAHVIVAPDKFKGSLTAAAVAEHLARGLRDVLPDLDIVEMPVADGGDGTLAALYAAGFTSVPVTAVGPTGQPVTTAYARRGDLAVVEMADVSGLARLPGGLPQPLVASSRGTGEVIAAALDAGCTRLILAIGGSASTDGGAGLARALGVVVRRADGTEIGEGGAALGEATAVDLSGLHPRIAETEILLGCDVDHPLTGADGAAAVFGPQKGADEAAVSRLDLGLRRWAAVVSDATGADKSAEPGAGAAGGVGFAALALLDATMHAGVELLLDLVGFRDRLSGARLVITGEGSLDAQSLRGKAPLGVATAATRAGIPVIAVCGRLLLSRDDLNEAGFESAYSLHDVEPDPQRCMSEAPQLLAKLGRRIARDYLASMWSDP